MSKRIDVAIIGAGPYGLSLAAHLRKRDVNFSIFGKPMGTWRTQMPAGMCLKSEGFASNLYDPEGDLTLEKYCKAKGIAYAHTGLPVKLDTFAAYGLAFQRKFVPDLNENLVKDVIPDSAGFRLVLEDGTSVLTRRVVVAAGITHYQYLPPALAALPTEVMSHSSRYHEFISFKGKNVAVVGAGASAIDVAVSLFAAGAHPQIVTRRAKIPFHGRTPDKRSLITRIRAPWSGLGPGWRSRLACDLPVVFHSMPRRFRLRVVRTHLGPAPGWFTQETIRDNVPLNLGVTLSGADTLNGRVNLHLIDQQGKTRDLSADHVIAATGYRVDLERLSFIGNALRNDIVVDEKSPILSKQFESSVPGLFFIGASAANSFGPLLRFAFGAGFTSRRLSRHLTAGARGARRAEGSGRTATSSDSLSDSIVAQ